MDPNQLEDSDNLENLLDSLGTSYGDNQAGGRAPSPQESFAELRGRTSLNLGVSDAGKIEERYTSRHGDLVVNALRKHYIFTQNTVIKKNAGASSFCHSGSKGQNIGQRYLKLLHLMRQHSLLKLKKDCINRLHQFEIFNRNIKKLVQEETASWNAINQPNKGVKDLEEHQTNLTALSSLCDEFRMHLNHWQCIKQAVLNNRWLSALLADLLPQLKSIDVKLIMLQEQAIWWTDKLLRVGMQVFAYVDRRSLTYNDVFAIVRGIEEYNTLLGLVANQTVNMESAAHSDYTSIMSQRCVTKLMPDHSLSSTLKPVQFQRLLNSLANEWAKSAVHTVRHFTDNHMELYELMRNGGFSNPGSASVSPDSSLPHRTTDEKLTDDMSSQSQPQTTSDYYSAPTDGDKRIVRDDYVNLTNHASPLLEFGKKEREYILKVIQIACQRTTLLRKKKPTSRHHTPSHFHSQSGETPMSEPDKLEGRRKTVRWEDSHDVTVCKQLTAKYDEALWRAFGSNLSDCLTYELHWVKSGKTQHYIGCVDFCSNDSQKIFLNSLRQAAIKGFFTSQANHPLLQSLCLMNSRTKVSQCDNNTAECISSSHTDKGVPVPLNGHHCTKTAMLIRDAVQNILPQLKGMDDKKFGLPKNNLMSTLQKGSPSHLSFVDYSIRKEAASRVLTLSKLCLSWSQNKSNFFISTSQISSYILIIYADTQLLLSALEECNSELTGDLMKNSCISLTQVINNINSFRTEAQKTLSNKTRELTLEIINSKAPSHKYWRQRSSIPHGDLTQLEINPYAKSLAESVLSPIVEATNHLIASQQIDALNLVIKSICETWQSYYLDNKIKISLSGAEQLRVDFNHLLSVLDSLSPSIRDEVTSIENVQLYRSIIRCLLDQPHPETSSSQILSTPKRNRIHPHKEITVEGQEKWSALKVHGNRSSPTLFNPCCRFLCRP